MTDSEVSSFHVAMASSEVAPFAKTGGLGDVLGSLPKALQRFGLRISLIMPAYRTVLRSDYKLTDNGFRFSVPISNRLEPGSLLETKTVSGIPVHFIRADKYFDREYPYGTPAGDYPDNAERFIFFSRAVLEVLKHDPPMILHAHEWHSALSIAFLKAQPERYPSFSSVRSVFTVHNLGHQGVFWFLDWPLLDLDRRFFTPRFMEFYSKINFLKGGLVFADAINTVSPTYAEEIKTPEQGFGLDGVLRERAASLTGILNGVDYEVWNPENDPVIAKRYGPADLSGKKSCKAELQRIFGLPENLEIPLVAMVSRLATQKGLDLLEKALEDLLTREIQLVFLASGDKKYEDLLRVVALRYPERVGVQLVFDEYLAHKVIAGADILLMPSRYEPGGLAQLYGLRYGTVPIARATGGLKDTVEDFNPETGIGNGFVFGPYEVSALLEAIDRALSVFQRKDEWTAVMTNGMKADFSWDRSAGKYLELYRKMLKG